MQSHSTRIRLLLTLVCMIAACCRAVPCLADRFAIQISPGSDHLPITHKIAYLIEGAPLDHLQVAGESMRDQWQSLAIDRFKSGSMHPPTWIRFELVNQSYRDGPWLLAIGWPLLDQIEVWQYNHAHRRWSEGRMAGNMVPPEHRSVRSSHFLFPLTLPPDEPVTVYVRLKSFHPLFVTLDVWQKDAFWRHDRQRALLFGLFFGILGVMALYNSSLYLFTRDGNYLYYASYGLAVILYELAATGFGARYVWPQSMYFRGLGYVIFASSSFLTGTLFVRRFLSLKQYGGWIYQLNNGFLAFWAAATIACLFECLPLAAMRTIELGALLSPIAGMVTGIYLWIKGNRQAKYYTIAFAFLNVGTVGLMLGYTGVVERGPFTEYGQMVGFVLELILLSLALADRINHERSAREEAQNIALDLSRKIARAREEKLMVQEQMLEVQRRANEELELRVLDRTNELERAMKNLEFANKELSKLSYTDPLTKVYNRRYFDQILHSEIKRASRTRQPVTLAIVDIDHFKRVNDEHGHLIGDQCLRLVAKTLSLQLGRSSDLIARFGGEEFAIILPATSQENAMVVADRARSAVADINFIHRGRQVYLSVSVGVAGWIPSYQETADKLIYEADQALYRAKISGRNKAMAAGR